MEIDLIKLYCIIISHLLVVIGNICGFFILAFNGFLNLLGISEGVPWYISLACCSAIFWISTTREECYLTKLENNIRLKRGMQPIRGFIRHYLLRKI